MRAARVQYEKSKRWRVKLPQVRLALDKRPHHRHCRSQFGGNAARPRGRYALCKAWFFSGSARMRLPVAAKIALQSAGATSAGGGSPTPPQNPPLGMIMVSTFGASARRTI